MIWPDIFAQRRTRSYSHDELVDLQYGTDHPLLANRKIVTVRTLKMKHATACGMHVSTKLNRSREQMEALHEEGRDVARQWLAGWRARGEDFDSYPNDARYAATDATDPNELAGANEGHVDVRPVGCSARPRTADLSGISRDYMILLSGRCLAGCRPYRRSSDLGSVHPDLHDQYGPVHYRFLSTVSVGSHFRQADGRYVLRTIHCAALVDGSDLIGDRVRRAVLRRFDIRRRIRIRRCLCDLPRRCRAFPRGRYPQASDSGAIASLGAFSFTMTALPGTPAIQNAIPMPFFGTTAFAAPGLGIPPVSLCSHSAWSG